MTMTVEPRGEKVEIAGAPKRCSSEGYRLDRSPRPRPGRVPGHRGHRIERGLRPEPCGSAPPSSGRPAKVQIDPLPGEAYHERKSGVDRHAVGRRRDHSAGAQGKMIYESADTGRGSSTANARVHLAAAGVRRSVSGAARSCTFVDEQYSPLTGKCSSRGGTEDRSCGTGSAFHNSVSTGSPDVGCPPAPRGSRRRGPGGLASPTPSRSLEYQLVSEYKRVLNGQRVLGSHEGRADS